jgi:hypothetical protein
MVSAGISIMPRPSGVETFAGPMTPKAFHALFGRIGLTTRWRGDLTSGGARSNWEGPPGRLYRRS